VNYLLNTDINVNDKLSLPDALSYGGGVVLLGMATVFAVLIIIWIVLQLFKFFFHDLKIGAKLKPEKPAPAPVEYEPVAPAPPTDEEIVAVIAAAIAMAESEAPRGAKFRVVSFTRK